MTQNHTSVYAGRDPPRAVRYADVPPRSFPLWNHALDP